MKIVSIKRLVLALILGLASVMTLPAYAWPDTDEMNMCGAAVKNVRSYANDYRGWAAHDNYIAHRGSSYYYRNNCPDSKATKNYRGKHWSPRAKHKMHKKAVHKYHRKHRSHHNSRHKNRADCVRTDALNNSGAVVKKVYRRDHQTDDTFYHQAQVVLNMSKVKGTYKVHNPNYSKHADRIRTDALNSGGAVVRVVRKTLH